MRQPDPKLLAIFEAEQREHLQKIRELIDPAGGVPAAAGAALEEAFRRAHTLKGAARAVGLENIEALAHGLEAAFARVREHALVLGAPAVASIHRVLESAEDVLAGVLEGRGEADISSALGAVQRLLGQPEGARKTEASPASGGSERVEAAADTDTMRVSARGVDELVRSSAQLLAATSSRYADTGLLGGKVEKAAQEWGRLRRQAAAALERLRADPAMASASECLQFADGQFRALAREARAAGLLERRHAFRLQQLGRRVYDDACGVRLTPAGTIFDTFRKMVRDLARDQGKAVDFHLEGMDTQADRLVLQRLKDPVMHLLRNAVSHGVEAARERVAAGKEAAGVVRLRVEAHAGRLHVSVEDDGRGIDVAKVTEAAIAMGLTTRAAAAGQPPEDLARLAFQPGVSTSPEVTNLVGRGMGLSVVQEEVARLEGEVMIAPAGEGGTSIELTVPLSVSTQSVLLVECRRYRFALPGRAIDRLCRVRAKDIASIEGTESIRLDGQPVALARLADLLGLPEQSHASGDEEGIFIVAVLRSGGRRAGLIVDALLDQRDALIGDPGVPAALAGMATGAIAMEDGSAAVVLHPRLLMERFRRGGYPPGLALEEAARKKTATILVVDDSITTRALEKSILEAHGYNVRVAVDGLEALEQLRIKPADLVITDLAMPRMDGFQLVESLKKDKHLAGVPVIIVTSLDKRDDQERGLSLGANAYIVKRKFDQRELLNAVRQIL